MNMMMMVGERSEAQYLIVNFWGAGVGDLLLRLRGWGLMTTGVKSGDGIRRVVCILVGETFVLVVGVIKTIG